MQRETWKSRRISYDGKKISPKNGGSPALTAKQSFQRENKWVWVRLSILGIHFLFLFFYPLHKITRLKLDVGKMFNLRCDEGKNKIWKWKIEPGWQRVSFAEREERLGRKVANTFHYERDKLPFGWEESIRRDESMISLYLFVPHAFQCSLRTF